MRCKYLLRCNPLVTLTLLVSTAVRSHPQAIQRCSVQATFDGCQIFKRPEVGSRLTSCLPRRFCVVCVFIHLKN